jgi:hypothetical protein
MSIPLIHAYICTYNYEITYTCGDLNALKIHSLFLNSLLVTRHGSIAAIVALKRLLPYYYMHGDQNSMHKIWNLQLDMLEDVSAISTRRHLAVIVDIACSKACRNGPACELNETLGIWVKARSRIELILYITTACSDAVSIAIIMM